MQPALPDSTAMADKQRRPVVVGIGELLWDLLPTGKQLGGAPANFAYHAAALGAASCVVSRVGNDALGQEALDRLDAMQPMSIDRRFVTRDPDHPTGTVDVQLSSSGVADYIIHKDVAWDFLPFTQELAELAGRTDAVCFGTLGQRSPMSRETIGLFLAAVPASCLKVLDINLRQNFYDRRLVHDLLMRPDILKLNESELPTVAALLGLRGEGLEIIQSLMSRYPLKLVALTRGPDGAAAGDWNLQRPPGVRDRRR